MMTLTRETKTKTYRKKEKLINLLLLGRAFFFGRVTIKTSPREEITKTNFFLLRRVFRFSLRLVTGSLKPQKYNLSSFMPEVSNKCVLWSDLLTLIIMSMNPMRRSEDRGVRKKKVSRAGFCFSFYEHQTGNGGDEIIYVNWY
jgi:hypothetical protein